MADTKISGMTAASALTGAEVLPVVQSAANVKATTQQVVDAAMTTGLTRQALGSINTDTTIDWSAGSYVTATIGGALTFTFSNPAPTGKACVAYLQLTDGGSAVITWPVSVTWSGGTAPTLRASGVDLLRFYTQDNGTTWFGTAEIDEQQFAASAITSGTLDAARLPTPTTTALGGVKRNTGSAGQFVTGIDTDGSLLRDTPAGGSPAGSGSELQYRGGASTFAAASGTYWDAVNGRLSIGAGTSPAGMLHAQASAASVIPAVLQGAASQTAPLQRWTDNAGATVAALNQTKSIELYNVDGANYERLDIKWLSNVAVLDVTKSGSGTQRAFSLRYSGSEAIGVATSGIVSIAYLQIVGQTIDFTGLGTLVGFRYQYASSSLVTYNPIQSLDYGRFYIATSASDQAWTHRSSPSSGTWLGIKVGSAKAGSYIRLNAASGQKIRIASGVSATGGYVRSNEAHAFLLMVWDSTEGEWVAWQQGGTWTIDS